MAPLCPCVDDVGLDAEPAGGIGDAELLFAAGRRVGVAVLVGRAGGAVAAGGFHRGREGDAPAPGRAAAGGEVAGVDPVVDGAGGHAGDLGDLARGELAVVEQAGVGDVVVVPQVAGGDAVEGLPGAGAVPGVVQRPGQGVVVQAGADAAGELDGGRVGAAQLDGVLAAGDLDLLTCPGFPAQPDRQLRGVAGGGGESDVAEQGAQQALAVLVAGGRRSPQGGQVGDGGR